MADAHWTRRQMMQRMLWGPGGVGLLALVTGIPPALLLAPERARAQSSTTRKPQFLLFSTSGYGSPLNANAPGTYDDSGIHHSSHPSMAATPITVGNTSVQAAQVWSTLPSTLLAQTCFFHHATTVNGHPDENRSLRLLGAVKHNEMLPSMLASQLASPLGTTRPQPINFNQNGLEALYYQGQLQPSFSPQSLAATLAVPSGILGNANLVALRDNTLDGLHAWAKTQGTAFQQAFIDQYALSQNEVRVMQSQVVSTLAGISGNDTNAQIRAALVLFKMRVTPVVMLKLPFGEDNHGDADFVGAEVPQHQSSIANMGNLPALIDAAGLTGQVSLAATNVFGRTLAVANTQHGRDHNPDHTVSLIVGPNTQGSVVGGVEKGPGSDYRCSTFDSGTGAVSATGDVALADSSAAYGRTLAASVGIPTASLDNFFTSGKVVTAALAQGAG